MLGQLIPTIFSSATAVSPQAWDSTFQVGGLDQHVQEEEAQLYQQEFSLRDPLWDAQHTLTSWKREADQDCRIAMGYNTSMELKQHTFSQDPSSLQEDDMRGVE